ncbi:hypothetical protein C8Q76DRAFT_690332 [Earliella scabrosa]|nr:hypothetical protein C8Q76DRAFT_690332 [Earliella scabrosa]
MSSTYTMLACNVDSSPKFDPEEPGSILDFFEDLDYHLEIAGLLDGSNTDHEKCIGHAVRLVLHQVNKASPPDYDTFKKKVTAEYLGNNGKHLYAPSDLDAIVAESAGGQLITTSAFISYSRRFCVVGDYFVLHKIIGEEEHNRLFLKGLPDRLQKHVLERLAWKCPDVLYSRVCYSVKDVAAAAIHTLDSYSQDTSTTAALKLQARPFSRCIRRQAHDRRSGSSGRTYNDCYYCTGLHSIQRCHAINEDTAAGLVKRDAQGQVVLRSGEHILGNSQSGPLQQHIQDFYKSNVSKPTPPAPAMLFQPVWRQQQSQPPSTTPSHPELFQGGVLSFCNDESTPYPTPLTSFALNSQTDEQVQADKAKIATARTACAQKWLNRFDEPPEVPRRLPAAARIEEVEDEPTITNTQRGTAPLPTAILEEVEALEKQGSAPPEHLFANVRDGNQPRQPTSKSSTSADKQPTSSKAEPVYKNTVPIHDQKHVQDMFCRCLETPMSLTQAELLSLAPSICAPRPRQTVPVS